MNLTAASHLFSLISGISVLLYNADWGYLKTRDHAGRRFKGAIMEHMPLTHDDDLTPGHAASVMWEFARNPLAHSFGLGKERASFPGLPGSERDPEMYIAKGPDGLHARQANALLRGDLPRPAWLPRPTISPRYGDSRGIVISVEGLSWATVAMLRSILRSPHRDTAENLARRLMATS